MSIDPECVFCRIYLGRSPAKILDSTANTIIFEPLTPITMGHVLVVPSKHVEDFTTDPIASANTMFHAARYAKAMGGPCNIITSKGREATQSVFHLHLHVIPRAENDGLALPWYSGRRKGGA